MSPLEISLDPNIVRPGWTPLLILLVLFGALTLLFLSMRHQIRKIHLPHRDEVDEVEEPSQEESLDPEPAHGPAGPSTDEGPQRR